MLVRTSRNGISEIALFIFHHDPFVLDSFSLSVVVCYKHDPFLCVLSMTHLMHPRQIICLPV